MTSNQFGAFGEQEFARQCRIRGVVAEAPPKIMPYDFTVHTAEGNRTVQVKVTRCLRTRDYNTFARIHARRNGKTCRGGKLYKDCGVDYIAAWVLPWNQWYIFPTTWINRDGVELRRKPTGRMAEAVNNWGVLDGIT